MNLNPKLRSDSVFAQLTNEQIEQLEDWLFEEKLSYKEVIEKIQKEFGVKTSQTALGRYFRRLAEERAQEWRIETIAQCLEALATAKGDGTLQAGLFAMANMQAVRLMTEEKPSFREITAWLRAMTSAGNFEMKRVEIYESREKERLAEIVRKEKEAKEKEERARWSAEYHARCEAREAKRKATIAAKKAEKEAKARAEAVKEAASSHELKCQSNAHPHPGPLPRGEGEELAQRTIHETNARASASGDSLPEAERVTDENANAIERSAVVLALELSESPSPAPEATPLVIPEVAPTKASVTEGFRGVTRDETGDFTINWGGRTP